VQSIQQDEDHDDDHHHCHHLRDVYLIHENSQSERRFFGVVAVWSHGWVPMD
jgi:hypothetical protein